MLLFEKLQIAILSATILAIVVGPIFAVIISRFMDRNRSEKERKFRIFADLMQTRRIQIDPMHVGALNLIELEFYKNDDIIRAYRDYINHLHSPLPIPAEQDRYIEERRDKFLTLVQAMGRSLGYNFDKHEIERLAYSPIGWSDAQALAQTNAQLFSEVLRGERAIRIAPHAAAQFPPPPTAKP